LWNLPVVFRYGYEQKNRRCGQNALPCWKAVFFMVDLIDGRPFFRRGRIGSEPYGEKQGSHLKEN
jgi:hypothetical protein